MQLRNDYYECLLVIAQVSADQNVPFFFLKKNGYIGLAQIQPGDN